MLYIVKTSVKINIPYFQSLRHAIPLFLDSLDAIGQTQ